MYTNTHSTSLRWVNILFVHKLTGFKLMRLEIHIHKWRCFCLISFQSSVSSSADLQEAGKICLLPPSTHLIDFCLPGFCAQALKQRNQTLEYLCSQMPHSTQGLMYSSQCSEMQHFQANLNCPGSLLIQYLLAYYFYLQESAY